MHKQEFTADEWPFADPPNTVAISTRQVLREGYPVLFVSHGGSIRVYAARHGTNMAQESVRRMLAGQVIVYLETEFATVAKRTGMDRPRVVIPGNPRGQLRTMLEQRRPVYAELATLTVSTDDLAPEEVAADLAKRLRT